MVRLSLPWWTPIAAGAITTAAGITYLVMLKLRATEFDRKALEAALVRSILDEPPIRILTAEEYARMMEEDPTEIRFVYAPNGDIVEMKVK